jgi:ATP-dependent protease HslVU (ClpYQ) ATPase subunit
VQGGLTPAAVVERLDKVIIGQEDAKKAVAIAFRNRCGTAAAAATYTQLPLLAAGSLASPG